jgi:uncharacterized protein YqgC (DUF456 family)
MSEGLVIFLVALAMAVGIVGTVVPVVPGLVLVWGAALVYGILEGFGAVGWTAFAVITVVAVLGAVAGMVLPHRAAGAAGASRWSVWFAFAVGVVGFFVIPVVGVPVGTVVGLFVAELYRTRTVADAWRSTLATLKGFGISTLVQMAAGLTMAVVWVAWVLLG